jgi:alkanesulfonate monooxygenase SsuD/methylene tetrahydromethanopterin reductase-like flavin-dependent oxidoreductase (luciferase family)
VWAGDSLVLEPGAQNVVEAWTILTAAAMVTKRVRLGTCVTDPHRYHPAVLAQRLATIDQVSGGRVILGLGAGVAYDLEPFAIRCNKPVSRLVEAVKLMRRLWAGEKFGYEGEFWRFKDASLQIRPIQSQVPIYFAANSSRTLGLTGELADGWLPETLSPELYKKRLKLIEEAARKAGRESGDIDPGLVARTSIADKAEDAYKRLDDVKYILMFSPYKEALKEAGYDVELPKELSSLCYPKWFPTSGWRQKIARYQELVPTEAAIEFSIAGTARDCTDKIDEYVKAGVKHFILLDAGNYKDQSKVRELYRKEIMPRFAE